MAGLESSGQSSPPSAGFFYRLLGAIAHRRRLARAANLQRVKVSRHARIGIEACSQQSGLREKGRFNMMKRILIASAVAVVTVTSPALAADVGVSVTIGQPGFYGRLDIGDYPAPRVIYRQPIVIERAPRDRPPVYLRVPRHHAKHWRKYCHKYNACGERVYFVQDDWYERDYVPRYQEKHYRKDKDRHDNRRDDRHGNSHHDKDKDHGRDH